MGSSDCVPLPTRICPSSLRLGPCRCLIPNYGGWDKLCPFLECLSKPRWETNFF
ncbi:hypothetical protein V6Z11_A09G216600 [Gossypium hirsutum]